MPAAAVIPAPIAYIKVVAVKKLVVEFLGLSASGPAFARCVLMLAESFLLGNCLCSSLGVSGIPGLLL